MGLSHTTILCAMAACVSQRMWFPLILLKVDIRLIQADPRGKPVCEMIGICVAPHCAAWFSLQTASLQIVVGLQQFLMATRSSYSFICS
jgi:hypothetical protein